MNPGSLVRRRNLARAKPENTDLQPPTIQTLLDARRRHPAGHGAKATLAGDPVGLFRALEGSGRFHRDTGIGRVFHPGTVSLRENVASNSLHISIRGNRLSAHVDRVSPLALRPNRAVSAYSVRQAAAHNLAGMAEDSLRLLRGRQGDHRCELYCEWGPGRSETVATLDAAGMPVRRGAQRIPSSVQLEVRVSGGLDERRLRTALGKVLGATDASGDGEPELLRVVDCADDDTVNVARTELEAMDVPLVGLPPVRTWLVRSAGGHVLMLNINHAAMDVFGALDTLRGVARAYLDPTEPCQPLDFLAIRDLPVRPTRTIVPALRRRYRTAVDGMRDVFTRPARLAPDGADEELGFGFHLLRLATEGAGVLGRTDKPGTARNVMVAALHLAIGQWNADHGAPGGRISMLVPVNLRPPDWVRTEVGNFSVTARVSTDRSDRSDPAAALAAVTVQTTRNKRTRTGIALIEALDRTGLLPLWAKQSTIVLEPLTGNRLVDTVLFANLGVVDDPPSFGPEAGELVEMWASVPARMPVGLSIGALTAAGQLHISLRYPRKLFGPDGARRFAECYVRHVQSVAATVPVG